QYASDLGSDEGIDGIVENGRKRGMSTDDLGDTRNPLVFVLRLCCRQVSEPRIAIVLRLAQLSVPGRSAPAKSFPHFAGKRPLACPAPAGIRGRLREAVGAVLAEAKMGTALEILPEFESDRVTFSIAYGGREHDHLLATEQGRELKALRFVICDVIRYE